jgi:hypothetical protein
MENTHIAQQEPKHWQKGFGKDVRRFRFATVVFQSKIDSNRHDPIQIDSDRSSVGAPG